MPADEAAIFWSRDADPAVLRASAAPTSAQDKERFDLLELSVCATHLRRSGAAEELLLGRPGRSVRLSIEAGTLLQGPVRLSYHLAGLDWIDVQLMALGRLAAWQRHRVSSAPVARAPKIARRLEILRTLDALAMDPRHRAVAEVLFGVEMVARDWEGSSDYLKSRVRRLIYQARSLLAGGYRRDLLRRIAP